MVRISARVRKARLTTCHASSISVSTQTSGRDWPANTNCSWHIAIRSSSNAYCRTALKPDREFRVNQIFASINEFFGFIQPISDAVWNFPTQFLWYSQIPLLGKMSFAVALLLGIGVYFTIRTRVVQTMCFARAIRIMQRSRTSVLG